MVLKGTYGEEVHKRFRLTRQGVRWRFQRLFSQVYVEAFETIFATPVGPSLRALPADQLAVFRESAVQLFERMTVGGVTSGELVTNVLTARKAV